MTWLLIGEESGYYFWETETGLDKTLYQCTKTKEPPVIETGYYNLSALLRLKGLTKHQTERVTP